MNGVWDLGSVFPFILKFIFNSILSDFFILIFVLIHFNPGSLSDLTSITLDSIIWFLIAIKCDWLIVDELFSTSF